MRDTISRQGAIDELVRWDKISDYNDGERNMIACCIAMLSALPSAQPDVPDTNVGDMISRQAALDALIFDVSAGRQNGKTLTVRYAEEVFKRIKALPPAQPGWIPCSRELPKPNEEDGNGFYKAYLVQDGRWMDVARWDGKYWIAWGYSTVLLNVVAWMPLPAPYIPEGDDKHEG